MRTIILVSVALTSVMSLAGAAKADDRLHLTPPLYREQARATQQTQASSDLTTTPQTVRAAPSIEAATATSAGKMMVEASAR